MTKSGEIDQIRKIDVFDEVDVVQGKWTKFEKIVKFIDLAKLTIFPMITTQCVMFAKKFTKIDCVEFNKIFIRQ